MRLSKFVAGLNALVQDGHGDLEVYYSHGASGDCGLLSSAHITDSIDPECGPFDLEEGERYISIYAGN